MQNKLFSFFFAMMLIFLGSCSPTPAPEIRIGLVTYKLKTESSQNSVFTTTAAQMAVDEVNQAGGLDVNGQKYRIRLIIVELQEEDSPEEAVAAVQKLINQESVVAIVGPPLSSEAIPAGQVAEDAHIPLISTISSNPQTTQGRSYVFRMGFVDDFQGKVLASFVGKQLAARNVAVLYDITEPYSRGIAEIFKTEFEKDGGMIVAFGSFTADETDLTEQLTQIRDAEPEVLVIPNYSNRSKEAGIQARKLGITVPFVGADGWFRQEFRTLPEFDGAFMTTNWSKDWQDHVSMDFAARYQEQFNIEPGDTVALTYDAFKIIFAAIQLKGKTDAQSIRDGLYEMPSYRGVSGNIDFIETGDPIRSVVILQFKNGSDIFYDIVDP